MAPPTITFTYLYRMTLACWSLFIFIFNLFSTTDTSVITHFFLAHLQGLDISFSVLHSVLLSLLEQRNILVFCFFFMIIGFSIPVWIA